jgi:hypothetical protein
VELSASANAPNAQLKDPSPKEGISVVAEEGTISHSGVVNAPDITKECATTDTVFRTPSVLLKSAVVPVAVLKLPVVLLKSAAVPTAVFCVHHPCSGFEY